MARTKNPSVRDRLRFRNNEAEARYAQYARRKVEGGRMANLAELAIFDVERAFGDMGWLPVITYDACTCPDLVRQFYCNLQVVGDYNDVDRGRELRITSYVKGVEVSFDYRQLGDLLGIPYDGEMVYCAPGEPQYLPLALKAEIDSLLLRPDRWQMRACYLRPSPRVYCRLIQHNLIPQSGHYERISQLTQYLLFCICSRQPVCLPYIIMRTMISATLSGYRGNLPYGRMITRMLTRLGVDLLDEKLQEKTFSSPLDWEAICKMGMQDAQVSDEERNAMVRPRTRVEIADAEAAAAAARAHADPYDDVDRMFMDMDDLPPPASAPAAGASSSFAADPSPAAGPSHPPSDEMLSLLRDIRDAQRTSDLRVLELLDAQRRTDQRVADLTASLQATQTQVAWLTRVYAEDYDRDREAPPPPAPPAP